MKPSEAEALLSLPEIRELLEFELAAHRKILEGTSPAARREIYATVYAEWPRLISAFNSARGSNDSALGFNPIFLQWFGRWLTKRDVLEVGCGRGDATAALLTSASSVAAIDVSAELVAMARDRCDGRADIRVADIADRLPFDANSFASVYWNDVAEHLHPDDLGRALDEIRRVLKPGGALCTVTCHRDDGPHDASMLIRPRGSLPLGVHIQEFTYRDWRRLLRAHGFGLQMPVCGPGPLSRLLGPRRVAKAMSRVGLAIALERSWFSTQFAAVRWLAGTNVVLSVGTRL